MVMEQADMKNIAGFADWLEAFHAGNAPAAVPTGIALAKERRRSLKRLIETDPERALRMAIPEVARAGLPAEIVSELETPVSGAGEFEMIVSCYTGGLRRPAHVPEVERFVTIGTARYRAFTYGRRVGLQTKDRISLHGIAIDDLLAMSPDPVRRLPDQDGVVAEVFGEPRRYADEEALERHVAALVADEAVPGPGGTPLAGDGGEDELPVAESTWTEGAKRILYLRVRFADQDAAYEPVSLATAQSQQADVEEHFRVASYGKMTVTTVFPDVITLPQNKDAYVGQGLGLMMNEARSLAITMGQAAGEDWDYANYDFYTIVSDGGIGGYAGIAQVGGRKSHLQKGYTSLRTAGHEFGHNFGLSHAYYNYTSDLNPRGATPTDGLGRVEYGHRFSIMSAQSGSDMNQPLIPHFTVHEKWRLDWLTDADFADVTSGSQSGTFRIYQNDDENATGQRAVRLPSGGALSKYWLSYRTAWRTPNRSSDNEFLLNGIVFDWTGSGGGTSTLLDMTPYSNDGSTGGAGWTRDNRDKWDAPLLIGRTYTDLQSQVSVTPVARGGAAPDEYIDVYVHVATGAETPLVGEVDACRVVVPDAATASGTAWTAIGFDDSAWPFTGSLGVGYDENPQYLPHIGVDVESAMNNAHESCYIRIPFTIDAGVNLVDIVGLNLRMRYDDGFVAYINGVKVAAANAPASPGWNSGATSTHNDSAAMVYDDFSADAALGALVTGANVLAIHGLNRGAGSSDFLIQPTLSAVLAAAPNAPPTVTLTAETSVAGVNQDITFTASGVDSDGDPLAYAWDFDIGDTFAPEGLNNAVAVRRWSSAGLYAVTVTCSDRKGGIARDRILVKVGSPSNDGIVKGRVLRGGLPVAGARVFIEGTDTQSITLADGSYLMAGLSTASGTTLGAMLDGEVFQASVAMPVLPDPIKEGVDFLGHSTVLPAAPAQALTVSPHVAATDTGSPVPLTAVLWDNTEAADLLVPFGDTWNYLDTGVDPGETWTAAGFDDSAWLAGAAELGYGDSQATEIGYGGDPANKHITSWFRRTFTVADAAGISRLKLSLKRDDGIRVFLNGTEIARDNLTTGTVSATTKASHDVSSANEEVLLHYGIDPSLLIDGENVIAAEVHQEDDDSGDLSFDLQLSAARNLTAVTPSWSVVPAGASVSPEGVFSAASAGVYTVTASSGALSDSATISVATDNVVTIEALDGFLWENGAATSTIRVSRTGDTGSALTVPLLYGGEATAGSDYPIPPSEVTFLSGEAFAEFMLSVSDDPDQEGREWVRITPVSGGVFALGASAVASVAIIDDENLHSPEPDAGPDATIFVTDTHGLAGSLLGADRFVSAGDFWKFDDSGTDLGTAWTAPLFADAGWQEGLAKFGYGDNDETTTVSFGGNASNRQITTYFRRRFYLANPADYGALRADLLVDDGAVVHVNGVEARRINLPAGPIGYPTRANDAVGGTDEETFFPWHLDPAHLVAGENILSVEVHQASPTSSDLGFDMMLRGVRAAPPAGTTFQWSQMSGPGTATFADDASLASAVSFDMEGTYVLRLTALHAGGSYSDDVTITVDPVPDYASWIAGFPVADAGPLADPDGDGLDSLLEFAGVTDPASKASHGFPVLAGDPAGSADMLFSYRRRRALDPAHANGNTGDGYSLYGINYTVEVSEDLSAWTAASTTLAMQVEGAPVDNGDGSETVTVRVSPPAGSDSQWFVRLRVVME